MTISSQPTCNLRFVERHIASENGSDRTVRILQQLWSTRVYEEGVAVRGGTEWRDIAIESDNP